MASSCTFLNFMENMIVFSILCCLISRSIQETCTEGDLSVLQHKSLSEGCRLVEAAKRGCFMDVTQFLRNGEARVNATCGEGRYTALHWAAGRGHDYIVRLLVMSGANVSAVNVNGTTPLHMAAESNHSKVVEYLVAEGTASVEPKNNMGCTPLHWAAHGGHAKVVQLLVQEKANVNAIDDKMGRSVLHWAASRGHLEVVEFLVTNGAHVNAHDAIIERSALHWAASRGDLKMAELLIKNGANVSARDSIGMTPLSWSSYMGHSELLRLLIGKGANPTARNKKNQTPFQLANLKNHEQVAALIQRTVTNPKKTLFLQAARGGRLSEVENFVDIGVNVDVKDEFNRSAAYLALMAGHTEIVKLLLANKAYLNPSDVHLMAAVKDGTERARSDVLELLVARGADLCARNGAGVTPLERAVDQDRTGLMELVPKNLPANAAGREENDNFFLSQVEKGNLEMVKWLVENGADVNASTADNVTALHRATISGNFGMVNLLLDLKAFADAPDTKNYTPLHYAVMMNRLDMVNLLLNKQANVDARSEHLVAPLHVAIIYSSLDIMKVLMDRGANVNIAMGNADTPLHIAVVLDLHKAKFVEAQGAGNTANNRTLGAEDTESQKEIFKMVKSLYGEKAEGCGKALLSKAAEYENLEVVAFLLGKMYGVEFEVKNRADVNSKDFRGFTLLHIASGEGELDVVNYLVENHADVNSTEWNGETPLHKACHRGRLDVVKFLVDSKADVNCKNKRHGWTPLHIASSGGAIEMAEYLLARGNADVGSTDLTGNTPLHSACYSSWFPAAAKMEDVVKLLVGYKAPVNLKNRYGKAPLYMACIRGYAEIVKFLVKSGANVTAAVDDYRSNDFGETPLSVACRNHPAMVMFLVEKANTDIDENMRSACATDIHTLFHQENCSLACKFYLEKIKEKKAERSRDGNRNRIN